MTEKKLATLARRSLQVEFFMTYDFIDLLHSDCPPKRIASDAAAAVCPPGYTLATVAFRLATSKDKQVTVAVKAKLQREGEAPKNQPETLSVPTEVVVPPSTTTAPANIEVPQAETLAVPATEEVKRPTVFQPIAAMVRSDDHHTCSSFECQDWFAQASDEDILQLADEGFKHEVMSDNVAKFFDGKKPGVTSTLGYVRSYVNSTEKEMGFGCEIDVENALSWIKANRLHLLPTLMGMTAEYADILERL